MSVRAFALHVLVVLALALAACGGDDGATSTEPSGTSTSTATVATADTNLGTVLVDGDGQTLYLFDQDQAGQSTCSGGCAETWPPVAGEASAEGGVDAALLGAITREDGTTQATYDGQPLYRYASDASPGDTAGQGVGGVWWVVGPDGAAVRDPASAGEESASEDPVGPSY